MNGLMRGNKRRGLRRLFCGVLTACLLAGSMDMPGVRAGQNGEDLVWRSGMEKAWQTERCHIAFLLADCWEGGYNAVITVQNVSDTVIDNWHRSASF